MPLFICIIFAPLLIALLVALKASGRTKLIQRKTAENGVTVAIALEGREFWRGVFSRCWPCRCQWAARGDGSCPCGVWRGGAA